MRLLLTATILVSLAAAAQKNADLERAQQQLGQRRYADALKSLEQAQKKGNLDRDSLLTLLESKGLAEASLKKPDAAIESFKQLYSLDPRREGAKYQGPVTNAIQAAQDFTKANGAVELTALDPGAADGKVKQVAVGVKNDPLKLVKSVRIYLKQDKGSWKPIEVQLVNGAGAADTDAATIEWWAEALGERKDQLMFLGSAIRPIKQSAPPAAVAKADAPKSEVAPSLTPSEGSAQPVTIAAEPRKGSLIRTVSYPILAAAVVAAGVGIAFGAMSASARNGIRTELMAGGFDQQALYDRDQAAISQARVANILFAVAGALGLTGAVMFFVGG